MTIERIGADGFTEEIKKFYDMNMLSTLLPNLVFWTYGEKHPIPPNQGKAINMRRFENITVNAGSYTLTEGTPPTETQATVSSVEATISQYGQFSKISDLLELQAIDNILSNFSVAYGNAAAKALDIVVRDIVDATTTIQYADASARVGTSGVADATGSGQFMDAAEITEAVRTLERADVPKIGGNYVLFIHPDNKKDLFEDADIVESFQYAANRGGDNPMFTGVLGDWMGVRFVVTSNLNIVASNGMSGADIYETVMVGDGAYAVTELSAQSLQMIIHPRGTGGHTDPLEQYSTVGWKAAFTAVILDQTRLVKIYCTSSRSTAA